MFVYFVYCVVVDLVYFEVRVGSVFFGVVFGVLFW